MSSHSRETLFVRVIQDVERRALNLRLAVGIRIKNPDNIEMCVGAARGANLTTTLSKCIGVYTVGNLDSKLNIKKIEHSYEMKCGNIAQNVHSQKKV